VPDTSSIPLLPMPFFQIYLEALGVMGCAGPVSFVATQESEMNMDQGRIVEPVGGWAAWHDTADWGDDAAFVEDWFDAGDELQNLDTLVHDVKIDEPDRWERALHWVRSLLIAT
jgi:hypothetical protein